MSPTRLTDDEALAFLSDWPDDLPELALALRKIIFKAAPNASEKVAFNSLVYYRAGAKYGAIGGNVCGIGVKDGELHLGFIHGAMLPDPQGILQGKGKAKRHTVVRTMRDVRNGAIAELIRASTDYRADA